MTLQGPLCFRETPPPHCLTRDSYRKKKKKQKKSLVNPCISASGRVEVCLLWWPCFGSFCLGFMKSRVVISISESTRSGYNWSDWTARQHNQCLSYALSHASSAKAASLLRMDWCPGDKICRAVKLHPAYRFCWARNLLRSRQAVQTANWRCKTGSDAAGQARSRPVTPVSGVPQGVGETHRQARQADGSRYHPGVQHLSTIVEMQLGNVSPY